MGLHLWFATATIDGSMWKYLILAKYLTSKVIPPSPSDKYPLIDHTLMIIYNCCEQRLPTLTTIESARPMETDMD